MCVLFVCFGTFSLSLSFFFFVATENILRARDNNNNNNNNYHYYARLHYTPVRRFRPLIIEARDDLYARTQ